MHLSKSFVGLMGLVLLFLLISFVTEEGRCITRARRLIQQELSRATPALLTQLTCELPTEGVRTVDELRPHVTPSVRRPEAPYLPVPVGGSRRLG